MQLRVALMRVPHPQNVILVIIEARECQSLEIVHHRLLLLLRRCVFGGKRYNPAGIAIFVLAVVNKSPSGLRVPAQNFGRRTTMPPLAAHQNIFTGQVFGGAGPTATTAREKFNQHRYQPLLLLSSVAEVRNRRELRINRARWPATRPALARHQHRLCKCSPIGQSG